MGIESKIATDLAGLSLPVFEQGSWTDGELPATFVTYTVVDSVDVKHYGNTARAVEWQLQVNLYAEDPDVLDTKRDLVISTLVAAGYTRDGRGFGGELDKASLRYPWYMEFYLLQKEVV